jgi:hypothetical protein
MLVRRDSGGVGTEVGWEMAHFLGRFFGTLMYQRILDRHGILWALEICLSLRCGALAAAGVVIPQTVRDDFCGAVKEGI